MKAGLGVTTAQFVSVPAVALKRRAEAGAVLTRLLQSWFASVFYFGYLVATWPVSILLQKYPVSWVHPNRKVLTDNQTGRVMGIIVFIWGIVCAVSLHQNRTEGRSNTDMEDHRGVS